MKTLLVTLALMLAGTAAALAAEEVTLIKHGLAESVAIPATAYSDFSAGESSVSFTVTGGPQDSGERVFEGGSIKRVSWAAAAPDASGNPRANVTIELDQKPVSSLINAVSGTRAYPDIPQVITGFSFRPDGRIPHRRPVAGGRSKAAQPEADGNYQLPRLPSAHYSDALVTLKVQNTDFREVLWLLSEIGEVSIMLDPYWNDEPTGSRRPVGGGASGDAGGNDNGGGFRNGSDFDGGAQAPREGTGNLSLDFKNVPFDLALDLVLQAVGLVKVDVYPGDMR